MKIKRFSYIFLIAAMLACNFVTSRFTPPTVTPAPTLTATLEPLAPAYIPSSLPKYRTCNDPASHGAWSNRRRSFKPTLKYRRIFNKKFLLKPWM